VIRHRNHFAVRSNNPVALNSNTATLYDFSSAQSQAYQNPAFTSFNAAMVDLSGNGTVFGMWGGDANSNHSTRASGAITNNDYAYIVNILLSGNTGNVLSSVYNSGDLNLDGFVRASGSLTSNDYAVLFNTILGGNSGNVYFEHN